MQRQQRRLWATALLACVSLLAGMPQAGALPPPRAVATVTAMSGQPLVKRRGSNVFSTLALRGALYPGDIVRTGPNSKAELLFSDGTLFKLNVNSALEVTPYSGGKGRQSWFRALLGVIWAKLRPGQRIEAPRGNIVVRGTEIVLAVAEDGTTTLTVVEGDVVFFNERGTVPVGASQQSTARPGAAPTPPVAVDVSGLVAWTAEVAGLPVEFETPFLPPDPNPAALQNLRREREAQVRLTPGHAEAQYRLGQALHDLGDYAAAVSAFEAAVRLNPGDAAGYVGLGQAKRGQGDVPGALAAFQRALQIAPDDADARLGLGLTYLARGDERQARATLEAAGRHAPAQAALGLVDLYEGRGAAAAQQLQSALAQNPRLYQAQALLALAYLTQNQLPQAEQAARTAQSLQPGSAQTQGILAMVLFFARQPEEATRAARRAVELNPLSPFALLTQGRVLLSQLKTDQARSAYEQAAALAPNLWMVHTELGAVYLRLDRAQSANEAYRRALALNPNSADAHTGLGVALQRQGRSQEAEAEHRQALALAPNNVTARGNLAALYIEQGRLDQARQQLEQGIFEQPERGILYARAAELSLYRQDLFAAQEFARRAVSLLPSSAIAHYQLGRVYLEQGRLAQAEQQFRQAATLDREFAAARFALGLTRERTETGLFPSLTGAAPPTLGSPSSALSLQNLQTPGAEERIQAAVQDPAVVRVASRSYGDTQLDTMVGEARTRDFVFSHLQTNNARRGVQGLTAERQETGGVRANADQRFGRVSALFGQKGQDSPSGVFLLAEYERRHSGLNNLDAADSSLATQRSRVTIPRLLTGFNLQAGERRRTRILLQYSDPRQLQGNLDNPDNRDELDFDSLNAEVRHDVQAGDKHLLSVGISAGARSLNVSSAFLLPPLPVFRFFSATKLRAYQAYLRDDIKVNERLAVTGELQIQNLSRDITNQDLEPEETSAITRAEETTRGLPNIVVAYQPNARSGLRFRARRLFGGIKDFQLLTPTDVFLFSLTDLPEPDLLGYGTSYEAEYDYTFRDSSFLRLGLFHLRLPDAAGGSLGEARVNGLRASYEGILNRYTTFFTNLNLNSARGTYQVFDAAAGETAPSDQFVAEVPRWTGEVGVQYLDRQGWFAQSSFFYLGRRVNDRSQSGGDLARQGGFSLVNVGVGKRWGLRSTLFFELTNVFDKEYAVLEERQPGRQLRFGVTQRF